VFEVERREERVKDPAMACSALASCSVVKPASMAFMMNSGVKGLWHASGSSLSESSDSSPKAQNLDFKGVIVE
jgi:pyridoxal biosynthesis lyase PdxS